MFKTEIICNGCESHFILVTRTKEQINFCPFCSEPYSIEDDSLVDDDEEQEDE